MKDQYRAGLKPEVEAKILKADITHNVDEWSLEELIQFVVNTNDILYRTRAMTKDNTSKGQAYHRKAGGDPEKPKRILDSMVNLRKKEGRCI